jgi:hypothetical protein
MAFRQDLRRVRAIIWKDLTTERRSKAGFNAVAFLGVLILLLVGFALGPDAEALLRNAAAGALWLAILFSGVLAFNRSYQLELDGAALEPLLLYPAPRWTIFAGKFAANLLFVLLVEAIIVPVAIILFQVKSVAGWVPAAGVMLLGSMLRGIGNVLRVDGESQQGARGAPAASVVSHAGPGAAGVGRGFSIAIGGESHARRGGLGSTPACVRRDFRRRVVPRVRSRYRGLK